MIKQVFLFVSVLCSSVALAETSSNLFNVKDELKLYSSYDGAPQIGDKITSEYCRDDGPGSVSTTELSVYEYTTDTNNDGQNDSAAGWVVKTRHQTFHGKPGCDRSGPGAP